MTPTEVRRCLATFATAGVASTLLTAFAVTTPARVAFAVVTLTCLAVVTLLARETPTERKHPHA